MLFWALGKTVCKRTVKHKRKPIEAFSHTLICNTIFMSKNVHFKCVVCTVLYLAHDDYMYYISIRSFIVYNII